MIPSSCILNQFYYICPNSYNLCDFADTGPKFPLLECGSSQSIHSQGGTPTMEHELRTEFIED